MTLAEVIINADINLNTPGGFSASLGLLQLHNAVILIDKGYDLYDDVSELINKYSSLEDAPEKK